MLFCNIFYLRVISLSLGKTIFFGSNDSLTGRQGFEGRSAARNEERKGKKTSGDGTDAENWGKLCQLSIVVYEYV